jgi:hypothetical protein
MQQYSALSLDFLVTKDVKTSPINVFRKLTPDAAISTI